MIWPGKPKLDVANENLDYKLVTLTELTKICTAAREDQVIQEAL